MSRKVLCLIVVLTVVTLWLSACAPITTPVPPTAVLALAPTNTVAPTDTPIPTAKPAPTDMPPSLIGKWRVIIKVGESSWPGVFSLELKDDGSAALFDTTATDMRGIYRTKNNDLTFNFEYFDSWMKCSAPSTATYTWAINSKQLNFVKLSDDCPALALALTLHPLTRLP